MWPANTGASVTVVEGAFNRPATQDLGSLPLCRQPRSLPYPTRSGSAGLRKQRGVHRLHVPSPWPLQQPLLRVSPQHLPQFMLTASATRKKTLPSRAGSKNEHIPGPPTWTETSPKTLSIKRKMYAHWRSTHMPISTSLASRFSKSLKMEYSIANGDGVSLGNVENVLVLDGGEGYATLWLY